MRLDQPGALPGQIPQLADRRWRHEAGGQQTALGQSGQPPGVGDVGSLVYFPFSAEG
ncbi:MAG: hypothetical protein ACRDYA_13890 [Egibacteraceae bacterium]